MHIIDLLILINFVILQQLNFISIVKILIELFHKIHNNN